ncbi:hypothetical protein D3C76_932500 [compost metagenome]
MVARDSLIAVTTSRTSFLSRMMLPVSLATSEPEPMAMPMSAVAKAGASLTPSPTMATTCPSLCSCLITAALSSGKTSAITRSMPTCRAIASAVRWLSPLSSTTLMPLASNAATASAASGLMVSATAITPSKRSPSPTSIAVLPSASRLVRISSAVSVEMPWRVNNRRLPSQILRLSIMPSMP